MTNPLQMKKITLLVFLGFCCCTPKRNVAGVNELNNDTVQIADTTINVLFQSDSIKKYSLKMKKFFTCTEPSQVVTDWVLPFNIPDRSDLKMVSIISDFGTYRSGHVKGHRHSGIDIIPPGIKDTIFVYPINNGKVCLVRPSPPNKTVIIKHKLENGNIIYSSYIHLKDVFIENGQEVNPNTKIGILYTRDEALTFNGDYDHLHLEIKKRIDDYCCASWLCMSQEELMDYFENPKIFLQNTLYKELK